MAIDIYPEHSPNSAVMHRCRIHVPDDNEQHPILYLLHGVGDSEDDWDDVSGRKGILSQWLTPDFPMYVVLPYCKPRGFPDGRQLPYSGSFPDAGQFVEYFEQGLVESLRNRYPNIDWGRQAIGGISMGGFLAFEIAARRTLPNPVWRTPFRCVGLFSAALQSSADRGVKTAQLAGSAPRLLYLRRQTADIAAIINSNAELLGSLGQRSWLNPGQPDGGHNWNAWREQLPEFLQLLRAQL